MLLVPGLLLINRLTRVQADQPTSPTTLWLWAGIWLIEAVLPLSLHLALKARPELERISLLIAGLTLLGGTLLTFLVFAPDLRKRA
jgi:formate-dependent nitrite reductase membrane component NrfD